MTSFLLIKPDNKTAAATKQIEKQNKKRLGPNNFSKKGRNFTAFSSYSFWGVAVAVLNVKLHRTLREFRFFISISRRAA